MEKQDTPPQDPAEIGQLVGDLGVLAQVFQTRSREILAPLGVTLTQMTLLSHLERHPAGQTIAELVAAIDIQQPGVSKAVARMESAGRVLVDRTSTDRRLTTVRLSDGGAAHLSHLRDSLTHEVSSWVEGFSTQDLQQLSADLRALSGAIDARRRGGSG